MSPPRPHARQPDAAPGLALPRRRALLLALPALGLAQRPAAAAADLAPLRAAADALDLHSLLVWQRGELLLQVYRRSRDKAVGDWFAREVDFGPEVLHDMRSISKSVVALLLLQAVGRGEVDLQQPVVQALPGLSDLAGGGRDRIRIEHLLTMSSGLAWSETAATYGTLANDETRLYWDRDPARYILDRAVVAEPGTLWNYNGGHTVLLAQILEQRSGRKLLDLVRTELFEPLGITRWEWRKGQHQLPLAYAGLRLAPPDLLRLGRLMLAGGTWEGRRVLPAEAVAGTLQPRVRIGNGPGEYGWHWWCGRVPHDGRDVPVTAAVGNGGQRLYLLPELDLAVVTTAGAYNDGSYGSKLTGLLRQIVALL